MRLFVRLRLGFARVLLRADMSYNFIDASYLKTQHNIPSNLTAREYWATILVWRGVLPDPKFSKSQSDLGERYNVIEKLAFLIFKNVLNIFSKKSTTMAEEKVYPSVNSQAVSAKALEAKVDLKAGLRINANSYSSSCDDILIIIPIYNAFEYVRQCIDSVLKTTNCQLLLIDDCSTQLELKNFLKSLQPLTRVRILENKENIGFVRSVNRGLRESNGKHVVLLNSDTVVFDDWLSRLVRPLREFEDAWTVTAMSNAATIYSVPFKEEVDIPVEISRVLDETLKENFEVSYTEIPTCHGFCVAIHKDSVETIGYFDEGTFGKGYGEENDYSMRIIKQGKKNYLATNLVVHHYGSKSFGEDKENLANMNLDKLLGKHPNYMRSIQKFLRREDLIWVRFLAMIAFSKANRDRLKMVFTHSLGGGTEKSIELDNVNHLDLLILVKPSSSNSLFLEFRFNHKSSTFTLVDLNSADLITYLLRIISPKKIIFEHLLGYPSDSISAFMLTSHNYDVRLHDYFYLCPKIHLSGTNSSDCRLPTIAECTNCLSSSSGDSIDIVSWRTQKLSFLSGAQTVLASTLDVSKRYNKVKSLEIQIRPIDIVAAPILSKRVAFAQKGYKIAILGNLNRNKGSQSVLELAKEMEKSRESFELIHLGAVLDDRLFKARKFRSLGSYASIDELDSKLADIRPDLFLFPSKVPETFSFTLSEALRYELPIAYFDTGAIAERLGKYRKRITLELDDSAFTVLRKIELELSYVR